MRNNKLDLSYKDKAYKIYYDIESVYDLFTIAFMSDKKMTLLLYGNEKFLDLSEENLINQMKNFTKGKFFLSAYGFSSHEEALENMEFEVRLYNTTNKSNLHMLFDDISSIINCNAFQTDLKYCRELGQIFSDKKHSHVEYIGWNTFHYDLTLLIMTKLLMLRKSNNVEPKDIRQLSDLIINFNQAPFLFNDYVQQKTENLISSASMKFTKNLAIWRDGHLDLAKLSKNEDSFDEKQLPPALKKEMAKKGMDVIEDDNVKDSKPRGWSKEEKEHLVEYNFNDVLGTKMNGENSLIKTALKIRDGLCRAYPYVAARSTPFEKLATWTPNERDATAATYVGLVLNGPYRQKSKDYEFVDYAFPLPDGNGGVKIVDLLEYMKEHEQFMHPYMYKFFDHFRGKDTTSKADNYRVKITQPITKSSKINIPYYRDSKPIDAYIRISAGGAHGSVCSTLSTLNEEEVKAWIVSDKGALDSQKPTIDLKNVLHADWTSFYPTMASKIKLYPELYNDIIDQRVQIKESLPLAKADYTPEDWLKNEEQDALKFVLNNATGAGNTHNKYALLSLDNKTLSMRLIGNMLIWCLAQRLVQEGAYIISTNTDGIYFTNISLERAKEISKNYVDEYGMGVEPETIERFINRDTSNRIEYAKGKRQPLRGRLRHAESLIYTDYSLGANVQYPLISANAVIQYMDQEDWLIKPYDKKVLRSFIEKELENKNPQAFYHVYVGTKARKLVVGGKVQQKVNRVILTKSGEKFNQLSARPLTTQDMLELWNHSVTNDYADNLEMDGEVVKWANGLPSDYKIDKLIAMKKVDQGRHSYYEEVELKRIKYSLDKWKELKSEKGFAYLGYYDEIFDEEGKLTIEPISRWKLGEVDSYPTNPKGKVVNTLESLEEIDYSDIDVDAYLEWAERYLESWKVTADIPEIGLYKTDDAVTPKVVKKRVAKKDVEINKLRSMYEEMLLKIA